MKILVSTFPFSSYNQKPLEILKSLNCEIIINPFNKKLTSNELISLIDDIDILIAGTENITKDVIDAAPKLKLISRVGIGLDNIDIEYAKFKDIKITYTPDAPSPAVAELTLALMLSCSRKIYYANSDMHNGIWNRYFGRRLSKLKIGLIGVGRIGKLVIKQLESFGVNEIYLNDIEKKNIESKINLNWVDKSFIYSNCDIISLHLPFNNNTKNLITSIQFEMIKKDVLIINTSRGGIVNEKDLYNFLNLNSNAQAAIDVFEIEPYYGNLNTLKNCILTSHMGSMSEDCRLMMELEACIEANNFVNGIDLKNSIPNIF